VCFIAGALPGEVVTAERIAARARFEEYRVRAIESASPARAQPPCPWYGRCGGCDLQHVADDRQRTHKTEVVLDALARQAGLAPEQLATAIESAPLGYRARARLAVAVPKRGPALAGFRESSATAVVPVDTCVVLAEPLARLPGALAKTIAALEAPRALGHVDLAVSESSDGACHAVVGLRVTAPLAAADRARWLQFAAAERTYLAFEGADDVVEVAFAPAVEPMGYRLPQFDLRIEFVPGDFVQANAAVNRALVDRVVEWVEPAPGMRVLDAFSGLGNFTLPLARRGARLLGLEASRRMVVTGAANAARNGVDTATFAVRDLQADDPAVPTDAFDVAVLDPPRTGALNLVSVLARRGIPRLVYVSCMPASLARDAKHLADAGYALERLAIVDMFPQTSHVEAVALFVRRARTGRRPRRGSDRGSQVHPRGSR
jgi:23S rRNA (uracil1939-C5)-methyltransferase